MVKAKAKGKTFVIVFFQFVFYNDKKEKTNTKCIYTFCIHTFTYTHKNIGWKSDPPEAVTAYRW